MSETPEKNERRPSLYQHLPFTRADLLPAQHPPGGAEIFTVIDHDNGLLHVGRWERVPLEPAMGEPGRFEFHHD